MKPTTQLEAFAAILHTGAHDPILEPSHVRECAECWVTLREAENAQERAEAIGWHLAPDVSLPSSAPKGKRETSRKAAASIADLKGGMRGVYELVACNGSHGLTDEQINDQYPGFAKANGFASLADGSPRKRRMDLASARYVIDSGRTRLTRCGNEAIVWVARGALEVAA